MRLQFAIGLLAAVGTTIAAADNAGEDSKIHVELGSGDNSGWNTALRGDQAPAEAEGVEPGMSELWVTLYAGRGAHRDGKTFGPVRDGRGRLLEMDVATEIETCPDGNTRVAAVSIGTWRYRLDGSCADFRRSGHVSVQFADGASVITTRAEDAAVDTGDRRLRCDAGSWTCRLE